MHIMLNVRHKRLKEHFSLLRGRANVGDVAAVRRNVGPTGWRDVQPAAKLNVATTSPAYVAPTVPTTLGQRILQEILLRAGEERDGKGGGEEGKEGAKGREAEGGP